MKSTIATGGLCRVLGLLTTFPCPFLRTGAPGRSWQVPCTFRTQQTHRHWIRSKSLPMAVYRGMWHVVHWEGFGRFARQIVAFTKRVMKTYGLADPSDRLTLSGTTY